MKLSFLKNKYLKWFGGILGAIILGAIGSGVWESILKHLLTSTRDFFLNIVSLGIKSYKDATYSEIGKGFHEASSLDLQTLFVFLLIFALFGVVMFLYFSTKHLEERHIKLVREIENDIKEADSPTLSKNSLEDIKKSLKDLQKKANSTSFKGVKIMVYSTAILVIMMSSFLTVDITKVRYVNSAITHFKQLDAIVAPFLKDSERLEIVSSFAQIKSKEDYVAIIQRLETVAQQNGKSIPQFSVW
jgi:hypothetical protein